jgi:hypothetical protein
MSKLDLVSSCPPGKAVVSEIPRKVEVDAKGRPRNGESLGKERPTPRELPPEIVRLN